MTKQKKPFRVPRTKTQGYKKIPTIRTALTGNKENKYIKRGGILVRKGKRVSPGKTRLKVHKVRSSITPGCILILLSSCHRGKRVICLGILPSGLLLITGPFRLNGVPLRRVNPRYVIATSKKVDVSKIDIQKYDDNYFGRSKAEKNKKKLEKRKEDESIFINQGKDTKCGLPEERKRDQDTVDKPLITVISKDSLLKQYLQTRFTLRNNMYPHEMKF